jgi:2-C-methyl-D-erythritol 4-phosphate cytidylyltransferase
VLELFRRSTRSTGSSSSVRRLENAQREVESVHPNKRAVVKAGGESRQDSVRMGLALGDCDFVLVHDAARPLATASLVRCVLAAAMEWRGLSRHHATRCREPGNRLAEAWTARGSRSADAAGFCRWLLARAHREAADAGLVGDDDAQLVAATGHVVTVVPGEPVNIKLTTPEDLEVMEALVREHETAGR